MPDQQSHIVTLDRNGNVIPTPVSVEGISVTAFEEPELGYHHKETYKSGDTWYYNEHGRLHRTDGPSVELASGTKAWHINGKRHREDGPAIEYATGRKEWYIDGHELTEEQFNRWRQQHTASLKLAFEEANPEYEVGDLVVAHSKTLGTQSTKAMHLVEHAVFEIIGKTSTVGHYGGPAKIYFTTTPILPLDRAWYEHIDPYRLHFLASDLSYATQSDISRWQQTPCDVDEHGNPRDGNRHASQDTAVDYDYSRNKYYNNDPTVPGGEQLEMQQIYDTDLNLPDTQRKQKELVDFQGRENLQLSASKLAFEEFQGFRAGDFVVAESKTVGDSLGEHRNRIRNNDFSSPVLVVLRQETLRFHSTLPTYVCWFHSIRVGGDFFAESDLRYATQEEILDYRAKLSAWYQIHPDLRPRQAQLRTAFEEPSKDYVVWLPPNRNERGRGRFLWKDNSRDHPFWLFDPKEATKFTPEEAMAMTDLYLHSLSVTIDEAIRMYGGGTIFGSNGHDAISKLAFEEPQGFQRGDYVVPMSKHFLAGLHSFDEFKRRVESEGFNHPYVCKVLTKEEWEGNEYYVCWPGENAETGDFFAEEDLRYATSEEIATYRRDAGLARNASSKLAFEEPLEIQVGDHVFLMSKSKGMNLDTYMHKALQNFGMRSRVRLVYRSDLYHADADATPVYVCTVDGMESRSGGFFTSSDVRHATAEEMAEYRAELKRHDIVLHLPTAARKTAFEEPPTPQIGDLVVPVSKSVGCKLDRHFEILAKHGYKTHVCVIIKRDLHYGLDESNPAYICWPIGDQEASGNVFEASDLRHATQEEIEEYHKELAERNQTSLLASLKLAFEEPESDAASTARDMVGDNQFPNMYWVSIDSEWLTNLTGEWDASSDAYPNLDFNMGERETTFGPYTTYAEAMHKVKELCELTQSPVDSAANDIHAIFIEDRLSGTIFEARWEEFCDEGVAESYEFTIRDDTRYTQRRMQEEGQHFASTRIGFEEAPSSQFVIEIVGENYIEGYWNEKNQTVEPLEDATIYTNLDVSDKILEEVQENITDTETAIWARFTGYWVKRWEGTGIPPLAPAIPEGENWYYRMDDEYEGWTNKFEAKIYPNPTDDIKGWMKWVQIDPRTRQEIPA